MELTNSKRLLYTASYVTTQLKPEEQRHIESKPGGGFAKAHMLRSLDLGARDLARLQAALNTEPHAHRNEHERLFALSQRLTDERPMSMLELASAMAPLSYDAVDSFVELSSKIKGLSFESRILLALGKRRRKISPIGRIHLERIEMYPAGVQKGELVFTVPMAPGETVMVSHKEWSTSTREFEEIVQDFFESYSERGVAEKSDAAMSAENEATHSNALSFGASVSGTYAGITLTTSLGITDSSTERQSVKHSMQKNREVTEKASARSRKEHKVSMKVVTATGSEDRTAKTITNPGTTALRIDYYRMMRKWRTDLFRYGLRQTYDVAIPLPGVRFWGLHQRLAELEAALRTPFTFSLKPDELHNGNWMAKAAEFETPADSIVPPPHEQINVSISSIIEFIDEEASDITRFGKIDFEVPAGFELSHAEAVASVANWPTWSWQWRQGSNTGNMSTMIFKGDLSELYHRTGPMSAIYSYRGISFGALNLFLRFGRRLEHLRAWQLAAWGAIRAAAKARHDEKMARLQEERDRLWRLLNGKDTLSLRRLEREELVRLVMQWLLGPSYPVVASPGDPASTPPTPPGQETMSKLLANERAFQTAKADPPAPTYSPTFGGVTDGAWYDAILFGEFVKFVHQAIEWENIVYFLYPYFWGSEPVGRDKLLFEHGDPEHERFLRAGYARIVLTVRPGFEEAFTSMIENGSLAGDLSSPYLPIAQEIANFARTNYAGIPPANPEKHARPLLFPEQRATWDTMQELMKRIDAFKLANGHYPEKLDDLPAPGAPVDAWGNPFVYRQPGLGADYDLVSRGADNEEGGEGLDADISSAAGASLVATWFDYTPTSAIDIEVDTKPEDIA
ncbi:MAG: type II secretion system protein GspG [Burkholderiales bacterium]|nr:type II secretion system protein GspG [Burkholderiales bacterium]